MLKEEKGMTIFMLIITIMIMLILAGVTIVIAIQQFNGDLPPEQLDTPSPTPTVETTIEATSSPTSEPTNSIVPTTSAE